MIKGRKQTPDEGSCGSILSFTGSRGTPTRCRPRVLACLWSTPGLNTKGSFVFKDSGSSTIDRRRFVGKTCLFKCGLGL